MKGPRLNLRYDILLFGYAAMKAWTPDESLHRCPGETGKSPHRQSAELPSRGDGSLFYATEAALRCALVRRRMTWMACRCASSRAELWRLIAPTEWQGPD